MLFALGCRGRRRRTGWKEQTQGHPQRTGDAHHSVCHPTPQSETRASLPSAPVLPLLCPSPSVRA